MNILKMVKYIVILTEKSWLLSKKMYHFILFIFQVWK